MADSLERAYFASADPADLSVLTDADRAGAARAHLELAAHRTPGTDVVRVVNPSRDTDGWESPHTVVEIVTDDMPFVVDSVSALLAREGYEIHLLVHPVVDGESFVHAEIDRESDRAILDALAASIESALADVRAAVDDWKAMRDRALALAAGLRDALPRTSPRSSATMSTTTSPSSVRVTRRGVPRSGSRAGANRWDFRTTPTSRTCSRSRRRSSVPRSTARSRSISWA